MMTLITIAATVTGLWLVVMAFIMNTKNWQSALVFRVIPSLMGFFWLAVAVHLFLTILPK